MTKENYHPKIEVSPNTLQSAAFTTQLERDKQLLTLSSSGIALLVTLLRTVGVSNLLQIGLFAIALFAFLVTMILVLATLSKNTDYIEQVMKTGETKNKYMWLDKYATLSFIIGIVMVIGIGLDSAIISLNEKELNMYKNNINNTHLESVQTNNDSWGRTYKLCPEAPKGVEKNSATIPGVSLTK